MDLKPVERRSVADAVFDQLSEQILGGVLVAGDALPAERSLTDELKVNRQAVREALKRLAQSGLVSIKQGEPTRVNDFRRDGSLDLLPHLVFGADGSFDPSVIRSVLEMRACIGPDMAGLCAMRARPGQVSLIAETVSSMAATDDLAWLSLANLDLWDVLADGADNVAYRLAFNSLRRSYEPMAGLLSEFLADELLDVHARRLLAEAIAASDVGGARDAAARLLAPTTVRLTELLSSLGATIDEARP